MQREPLDKHRISQSTQKIETNVQRISKIIDGLKTFARDGTRDPMEKVDVANVINNSIELCSARFRTHNIKLTSDVSEGLFISGRLTQLEQVVVNLLSNSFDAIESLSDKWVRVHTEDRGTKIAICVVDSGSGIPADVAQNILQPFFTTKHTGKGTGLGLSISKGIIDDHNGELFVDEKYKNTCFTVLLPKLVENDLNRIA